MSNNNVILDELKDLKTNLDNRSVSEKKAIDELNEKLNKMNNDFKELEGRLIKETSGLAVSVPGVNEGKEKFSFQRAIKGIYTQDWLGSEYERDVFKETEKRAVQSASVDAHGGFLIPVQVSGDFIDTLRKELIMDRLGIRVLSGLPYGIYEFVKKTSNTTVHSKSELGKSQRTSVQFSSLKMSPKIISGYTPISERLLRASNPSIENIINEDLRMSVKEKMEDLLFFGSGAENEPLGLTKTTGVLGANNTGVSAGDKHYFNSDAAAGHALTIEELVTLEGELADRNALPSGPVSLATNHGVGRLLRTEKYWTYDASGATEANKTNLPMRMQMPLSQTEIESKTNVRMMWSNTFAISGSRQGVYTGTYDDPASGNKKLSYGVYGDYAQVLMAIFAGMSIRASREASDIIDGKHYNAFINDQVWVKISAEMDVGVRQPDSLIVLNNLKTRRA